MCLSFLFAFLFDRGGIKQNETHLHFHWIERATDFADSLTSAVELLDPVFAKSSLYFKSVFFTNLLEVRYHLEIIVAEDISGSIYGNSGDPHLMDGSVGSTNDSSHTGQPHMESSTFGGICSNTLPYQCYCTNS